MKDRKPLQIFVSYSHEDGAWTRRLFNEYIQTTHGDCRIWTDAQIRIGQQWQPEIEAHLDCAEVAVLLVSRHFLKSKFIMTQEYPHLLKRSADPAFRLVWIPVNVSAAQLRRYAPQLLGLQGATGLSEGLPATPDGVDDETSDRLRRTIHQQIRWAVDPLGAKLARTVSHRYEVRDFLSEGNLASVYVARDRVLDRDVAVKALKDPDLRAAFLDDVRDAIGTAEHPSFVNIYDAGMEETVSYCVVQLIRGTSLRQRMADHPLGLPIDSIRRIFLGLASALAWAHSRGITHGNLKPSNIILNQDDEPFILPVGRRTDTSRYVLQQHALLERMRQRQADSRRPDEADSEDMAYLLPEHFGPQYEAIDAARSDQYMLGLLTWEMIAGRSPATVEDIDSLATLGVTAFEDLPALTNVRRLCPRRIASLVSRMAARRPGKRFPSMQAVLDEARMMEDLSLSIAKDSYSRCAAAPGFDAEFFQRFYAQFMQRCPAAAPYFAHFGPDDWARQHRMLKEAVLLLFAFRQQNDAHTEPNVLTRIAATHARIPAAIHEHFVEALLRTLCGDPASGLAPFDPECLNNPAQAELIEHHWRLSIEPALRYLQGRTETAFTA